MLTIVAGNLFMAFSSLDLHENLVRLGYLMRGQVPRAQ